jgi:hypothetical protein
VLQILADENFNQDIVSGILLRDPGADIVNVHVVGLVATDDREILEWAANHGRALLTHDVNTVTRYAYERIRAGRPLAGVFAVPLDAPVKRVIDDLILMLACSETDEWQDRVTYLPL